MINPNDITTVRVDQLPPDVFGLTDLFPFETVLDQSLKQATFQDLVNFIALHSSAMQFEVKRLNVNQAYIDNNFDSTGLGINLCLGFAICNGNNGTTPMDGLVGVAYGTNYNIIGGFGGAKTHTLTVDEMPAHTHDTTFGGDDANDSGSSNTWLQSSGTLHTKTSTSKGGGLSHNNMQPYIVQLYIMKL